VSLHFDENVSRRRVELLKADYPGRTHLDDLGLRGVQDSAIWDLAKAKSLVLVTKDDDRRYRRRRFVDSTCRADSTW
jgi:predicted nuclease of predicted toxin-antitoxin system